ncbi:MAG: long-chain fatty acid--CoA ligase [Deferrisomatales bacterium]|nr:long-chain fatty acid--CoA ligase [Deferrisomatales bacterium]
MTIPEMIRDRHGQWKDRPCMRTKDSGAYRDVTWDEFYGFAVATAGALVGRSFQPGDRAAVLSPTRYEWAVADTAILTAGGLTVPLYPTLTRREVKDLLERSGSTILFASDTEQIEKVLPLLDEVAGLRLLVAFDPDALAGMSDPRVLTLEAFAAEGRNHPLSDIEKRLAAVGEDDVATVIFTSGTTGEPKGVALTHRNILSNVEASLEEFDLGPQDVCLAHLPLAHILERMGGYYLMLYCGTVIAYAENLTTVAQNLAEVRPTVAVSVPRIFEKVYAGIQMKAAEAPGPVKALTFWALGVARRVGECQATGRKFPLGLQLSYALADRLVFAKVREKMGGRIRFFISGGAPLSPELAKFFNAVGIRIYEGYGLTETSPVVAVNTPTRNRIGTVGPPLSNLRVRIAKDGEILVKGPSVFPGYDGDERATREAFTDDGFFLTGDIGELDADGFLKITDRKKDVIVTAGGKNVAPQKVENILKLSKYIADAMLFGDRKKFISAVIVPDPEWLRRYAQLKGIPEQPLEALVENEVVLDYYTRLVEELQRKAQLASYESVKKFVLIPHEFSVGDGEVTPTMKVRRQNVTSHYRDRLEALYKEGG